MIFQIAWVLFLFYKARLMKKRAAILLAAGKGTRMKSASGLPKVLHEVGGDPLLAYPLQIALELHCDPIVIVVGHGGEKVRDRFKRHPHVYFSHQKQQLGSAHAVLSAQKALQNFEGDVLILSGDVPLIQKKTIQQILKIHQQQKNTLSLGSFKTKNPQGYGRVLRREDGKVLQIIEQGDLTDDQLNLDEVNGGIYIAQASLLFATLKKIKKNPKKNEFFFTDLPFLLNRMGHSVGAVLISDPTELMGVNTRLELSHAEEVLQERIRRQWMLDGVTMLAPHRTQIHSQVQLSSDCEIHPDVALLGATRVGEGCVIEQGAILKNVVLGSKVIIHAYSHLENCKVESEAVLGPFARIRPDTLIKKKARVGNFVELKKTILGEGSKANHLSYLGDASIGKGVNIGAGTITCNYDGVHKFKTVIEDGAFIGSDTQLVAPVHVGKQAYVGAGTTITQDVPASALAISRTPQKHVLGYAQRKKKE